MAFSLSGLTAYVNENQFALTTQAIFGGKMFENMTIQDNVKGPTKLPLLAQQIIFQTDSCGFAATGDTTITQRLMTPGKIKINMEWCPKDLEAYYFREQLAAGAHKEDIKPVEEIVMDYIKRLIAVEIDKAIWQARVTASGGGIGSTVGMGTGNNAFFDGLRFQIQDNTGGYTNANAAGYGTPITTLTTSNMIDATTRLYRALADVAVDPTADVTVFMGVEKYTMLVTNLINGGATYGSVLNQGLNGGDPAQSTASGLTMPGTGLRCIPVVGLNGIHSMYAAQKSNLFLGVDSEADFNNMEMWWSQDARKFRLSLEFKLGTQIAYANQIAAIVL